MESPPTNYPKSSPEELPMDPLRRYQFTNIALFAVATAHALLTWSLRATVALFAGGAAIAFAAELVGVQSGLLDHDLQPQLAGVPLSILFAWPSVVYICYRIALLVVAGGIPAAAIAAVLATVLDVFTDPNGVREGVWHYPEHRISEPRFRGVPWWNFAAWLVIVFLTALLPTVIVS